MMAHPVRRRRHGHTCIDHFSSRTVSEVVRRDGREQVKQELLEDFNSRLTQGQLLNIYFSDFVVQ